MRSFKRLVVAAELSVGAFILATTAGLLAQSLLMGAAIQSDIGVLDALTKTLIAMAFVGGALFYDGLRRGRRWW